MLRSRSKQETFSRACTPLDAPMSTARIKLLLNNSKTTAPKLLSRKARSSRRILKITTGSSISKRRTRACTTKTTSRTKILWRWASRWVKSAKTRSFFLRPTRPRLPISARRSTTNTTTRWCSTLKLSMAANNIRRRSRWYLLSSTIKLLLIKEQWKKRN